MNTPLANLGRNKNLVILLQGIAIGMIISALALMPSTSKAGDKYMLWFVGGAALYFVTAAWNWWLRRKAIAMHWKSSRNDRVEK